MPFLCNGCPSFYVGTWSGPEIASLRLVSTCAGYLVIPDTGNWNKDVVRSGNGVWEAGPVGVRSSLVPSGLWGMQ